MFFLETKEEKKEKDEWMDAKIDKQTDRQIDKQMDRQIDGYKIHSEFQKLGISDSQTRNLVNNETDKVSFIMSMRWLWAQT